MNETDKILDLLNKAELSGSEKAELDKLLSDIPDSDKIVRTFNSLKGVFGKNSHLDETLLGEYVLFKNNMMEEKRSILLLESKIEDHLRNCERCTNIVKDLNIEYEEVDSFLSKSIINTSSDPIPQTETSGIFRKISAVKYAFASITAIAVFYIGMLAASSVFVPDYKKHAVSEDERDFYNTRGRTSELFQRSLDAIDKKEYDNAIRFLEEDVNFNKAEASIFYSHFILGVTYIQSSESSFLGTFKSFNKQKVDEGIRNLQKAIELNTSGKYNNLNYDAHYFIGKAYLLVDNYQSARENFEIVVNNKGSYYKKAKQLLDQINKR
ncbi:MAG: hypothetical protein R6W68_06040 [Ignavibacteriaceae bacterium]